MTLIRPLRLRSPLVWLGALAAATVAVLAGWQLYLHDTAEPASIGEAIQRFQQQPTQATPTPSGATPGVYVYATEGFEEIDALGGARHDYPATSTITIKAGGCGTLQRWDVLKGRSTIWELCPGKRGDLLRGSYETHRFFGNTEHTDYRCTATLARPAGDKPGTTWPIRCRAGDKVETGRGMVVGRETIVVGGTRVPTVHLRQPLTLTGGSPGTSTEDRWVARADGLPVRIVAESETTTGSLIGDVHYQEHVELRLTSLKPRR